jgi:hypothetical protein
MIQLLALGLRIDYWHGVFARECKTASDSGNMCGCLSVSGECS